MYKTAKLIVILFLISILAIGLLTIKTGNLQEKEGGVCCNNLFPSHLNDPDEVASMHCDGVRYETNCYICALYWSAYVEIPYKNPTELCDFLPNGEAPPL